MNIHISDETKVRITRIGPVRTFGDFESRQKLNEAELVILFDQKWKLGLGQAVNSSLPCEYEVVRSRLQGKQLNFVDKAQEHRQFRYHNMDFIVQFGQNVDSKELTQLWKVQSGDDHPKTLFVTFDTVAERERFKAIADHLFQNDEVLGLKIIRDFMSKFDFVIPPIADDE